MKRYLQIFILPIMLFILGCEKDEPKEEVEVNFFVGTWRLDSGEIQYMNAWESDQFMSGSLLNSETTYETRIFNDDGTYSYQGALQGNPTSGSGTWSSTDEILTYIENGETSLWNYAVVDDTSYSCYITYPETDDQWTVTRYSWKYNKQ